MNDMVEVGVGLCGRSVLGSPECGKSRERGYVGSRTTLGTGVRFPAVNRGKILGFYNEAPVLKVTGSDTGLARIAAYLIRKNQSSCTQFMKLCGWATSNGGRH